MPIRFLMTILAIIFKGRAIGNISNHTNFMDNTKNVTLQSIAFLLSTGGGVALGSANYLIGGLLLAGAVAVLVLKGILNKYGIDAGAKGKK
jgi:hypothetical protein